MSGNVFFLLSLLASVLFLLLERSVGIGIDFHPDSRTYLTESAFVTDVIYRNPKFLLNHGYYFWSDLLGSSAIALIAANMIFFSFTNKILFEHYNSLSKTSHLNAQLKKLGSLIFLFLLFSPYRLHLSVHVLKDTAVVLFAVLLITGGSNLKYLWLLPIGFLRIFGFTYFVLFLRGKPLYFSIFLALVLSYIFQAQLTGTLLEFNSAEMNFREGTAVPSFQGMGLFGILLRMIIWPFLMLSGLFVIISPSPLFVPIAFSCFVLQLWALTTIRRPAVTVGAFGLLAILAALAPGFASYQRYCLPILTVLPILLIAAKQTHPKH